MGMLVCCGMLSGESQLLASLNAGWSATFACVNTDSFAGASRSEARKGRYEDMVVKRWT